MEQQKHTLAGRSFVAIGESTLEHDIRLMGLLRTSGLDGAMVQPGETPEDFAARLLAEVLASGQACEILGCLLIPEGVLSEKWTPQIGAETAAHIAALVDPADKRMAQALILSVLVDFFGRGLGSLTTSVTSSSQPTADLQTAS